MVLWTEYTMNEITFLGLFGGKEVGILNHLWFNSLPFFVESDNVLDEHHPGCLQRMFYFMWAFQSRLGTDGGWKGQKLCRTCSVFSCSRQAEGSVGIPAAVPPFLFPRCHFSKIQTCPTCFTRLKSHVVVGFVSQAATSENHRTI